MVTNFPSILKDSGVGEGERGSVRKCAEEAPSPQNEYNSYELDIYEKLEEPNINPKMMPFIIEYNNVISHFCYAILFFWLMKLDVFNLQIKHIINHTIYN